jgi:glycine cleavage system pyridoxal-binding protein P
VPLRYGASAPSPWNERQAGRHHADPISSVSDWRITSAWQCGVDVCVGEGQSLDNRLDFGGPSFGFFAATEEHLRRMPGRIAGDAG